jgi:glycosyltransferase involved in cell wall biosynthesis
MVTLIVPTRNRAYTLKLVARSFYRVRLVDEIVFVIDASTDDSEEYLRGLAAEYPHVVTRILVNDRRRGCGFCRMQGAEAARNELILYCDDDEFMEAEYAATCLGKLREGDHVGAVSGRRIFRQADEPPEAALARFGNGSSLQSPFKYAICELAHDALYLGDLRLPFTNTCILTRRELILRYRFDTFYVEGNGYREESDYQMNLFVNGYDIIVTNEAHTIHLHRSEVPSGGQRISRLGSIWWSTYYTAYFFEKYWDRYQVRLKVRIGRRRALALFVLHHTYMQFIRPLRRLVPKRRAPRLPRLDPSPSAPV